MHSIGRFFITFYILLISVINFLILYLPNTCIHSVLTALYVNLDVLVTMPLYMCNSWNKYCINSESGKYTKGTLLYWRQWYALISMQHTTKNVMEVVFVLANYLGYVTHSSLIYSNVFQFSFSLIILLIQIVDNSVHLLDIFKQNTISYVLKRKIPGRERGLVPWLTYWRNWVLAIGFSYK